MNQALYDTRVASQRDWMFPEKGDTVKLSKMGEFLSFGGRIVLVAESNPEEGWIRVEDRHGVPNCFASHHADKAPGVLHFSPVPNQEPYPQGMMDACWVDDVRKSYWCFGGEFAGKRDWPDELVRDRYSITSFGQALESTKSRKFRLGRRIRIHTRAMAGHGSACELNVEAILDGHIAWYRYNKHHRSGRESDAEMHIDPLGWPYSAPWFMKRSDDPTWQFWNTGSPTMRLWLHSMSGWSVDTHGSVNCDVTKIEFPKDE